MALDPLIHAFTDAVLEYLLVEVNAGEAFKDYLAHDPDKRALHVALTRTLHDFTERHPTRIRALLSDSALTGATAQTIGNLLKGASPPTGKTLAPTWIEYWNYLVPDHPRPNAAELVTVADDYVHLLVQHLRAQPYLWAVVTRTHHHPTPHTIPVNTDAAVALGAFEAALRGANVALRFIEESERRTLTDVLRVPEEPAAYSPDSPVVNAWEHAYNALPAEDQRRFRQTGRFPIGAPIPLVVLAEVWEVSDLADAQEYAATLHHAGLLPTHSEHADTFLHPMLLRIYAGAQLHNAGESDVVEQRTIAALAHHA